MNTAVAVDTFAQAPKFSRYRSVRKAAAPVIPEDAPALPDAHTNQLSRAPSRYHRANRPRTNTGPPPIHSTTAPLPVGQIPQLPQAHDRENTKQSSSPVKNHEVPVRKTSTPRHNAEHEFNGGSVQDQQPPDPVTPRKEHQLARALSNATRSPVIASPRSYEAAREEARMILEGEYDRLQKLNETKQIPERKPYTDAPLLKRKPTQVQQPKTAPVYVDAPKLVVKRKIERTMPDKFHDAPQSIGTKLPQPERQLSPPRALDYKSEIPVRTLTIKKASKPAPAMQFNALRFDAPISAVNAGDRRVEIRFNGSERGITLPVTPTTNSRDLLNSASIIMSEYFDPRTSVLIESFSKIGLERPLRRYEHIRDVMNSWDSDDQHYLTIMTESQCQTKGLERSDAPNDTPGRLMVQMYLSVRPGKWDRRWVTLRPDGQVTMSKNENDGDATNICHLSDFDVYTPTAKQQKKLKPPKKICFAVKSQQKSAMFLEGINFVHFFATSDKQVADQWYSAVQTWRSWYLVYVLGEGIPKVKQSDPISHGMAGTTEVRPLTAQSAESTPYQLGSFQPLLDLGTLDFGASIDKSTLEAKTHQNRVSKKMSIELGVGRPSFDVGVNEAARRGSRQRGVPPPSYPAKSFSEVDHGLGRGRISVDNNDQAFTGGGLLGRNASIKRLQGGKSSGIGIAGSRGKPLVDLTPASNFAEGSLLRKLEAWSATQGENELKVDRQRRVEADIKVGEGYD